MEIVNLEDLDDRIRRLARKFGVDHADEIAQAVRIRLFRKGVDLSYCLERVVRFESLNYFRSYHYRDYVIPTNMDEFRCENRLLEQLEAKQRLTYLKRNLRQSHWRSLLADAFGYTDSEIESAGIVGVRGVKRKLFNLN